MNKMKERGRRKAALADRKSAAAQARMKNIASLAADDRVPKKKRKAGAGAFGLQPAGTLKNLYKWHSVEDMFGADDEDWAIYRKIVTHPAEFSSPRDLTQSLVLEHGSAVFGRRR